MLRARNGSRDAAEALRHGDVHRIDRDAAVDIGLLREFAADGEREVGGRRHDAVGDDLRVLAGHANRAGEAGRGIEAHLAGRRDRSAVRRRAAQPIDADRISVGDEDSGDFGEPEAGLVVAELAIRQPDRPLRLGLGDGPAQLERERDRRRSSDGRKGTKRCWRARRRAGRRSSGRALPRSTAAPIRSRGGIGAARIDAGLDRRAPSGEPAGSRDVERRQRVAARQRQAQPLEPDPPVAGWDRPAFLGSSRRRRLSRTRPGPAKRDRVRRAASPSRLRGDRASTRRGLRARAGRNRRAARGSRCPFRRRRKLSSAGPARAIFRPAR